jgi:hypothetical protein
MTDDLIGYASGFEILFLASALVGSWLSRLNFLEAIADHRALDGRTNGRRMVAIGRIGTELILGSVHALYVIAALVAMSHPAGPTSPTGIVIQVILVYASWGMTAISFLSRRVGIYLMLHGLQNRDPQGRFVKATDNEGDDLTE